MTDFRDLEPELSPIVNAYQAKAINRREFMRRALATGLSLSGASALLAACASQPETATTAEGTTDGGEPVAGGTLREGYNRDVSKHDPLTTNWYDPAFFAIYETILTDDPDGETAAQIADTNGRPRTTDSPIPSPCLPEPSSIPGAELDATTMAEFYKTLQATSFIAGLAAPVDTYEAPDATTLLIKMKNPWIGVLGPAQDRILGDHQRSSVERRRRDRVDHLWHRVRRRNRTLHPRGVGAGEPRPRQQVGRLSGEPHAVLREQRPGPSGRHPLDGDHRGGATRDPTRERRHRYRHRAGSHRCGPTGGQLRPDRVTSSRSGPATCCR